MLIQEKKLNYCGNSDILITHILPANDVVVSDILLKK